jgi:mannose-6-phosphate isomerase-like protein (cupin superfamily)
MLIKKDDLKVEDRPRARGGEGTARFTHLAPAEEMRNMTLFAEIRLPPGASIGYHRHDDETEYFVFLSGSGTANDNGTETAVSAGDVMITGGGASHALANTGTEDLVLLALIV